MRFFHYYKSVILVAFKHSLSTAQDIAFLLLIGAGFLIYYVPELKNKMPFDMSGWQMASIVLGTIILVRLLLAPYWMYEESQATIQNLNVRLQPRIALDFGPDLVGCVKYHRGEPGNQWKEVVSVNIVVRSTAPLFSCSGALMKIEKFVNGRWERQSAFSGSQYLKWHHYGVTGLSINPGEEQLLHVVLIGSNGKVELPISSPDMQSIALINSGGRLKFDVSVSAKDCPPEYLSVIFEKGSIWNKPVVSKL